MCMSTRSLPWGCKSSAWALAPTATGSRSCDTRLWRNDVASGPDATTTSRGMRAQNSVVIRSLPIEQPLGRGRRSQQRRRLVPAFQVLVGGIRVCDDTGARLQGRLRSPPDHRADRDRGVEVAGEVEVADDARVRATLRRLQVVD